MNILKKILDFNKIGENNIKIELMRDSSFAFFRGTSHLFFEHLSVIPHKIFNEKELLCFIQGDSHIGNLGFSNKECSLNSKVRFDINDFDESFIGSPFLDVIRFGVSIGFFFDEINQNRNSMDLIYKDIEILEYFLNEYFKYASKDGEVEYKFKKYKFMNKMYKKAESRAKPTDEKARINKFTKVVKGKREFDFCNEKLLKLEDDIKAKLIKALSDYEIIDICKRKSAGVGSSHLDRYYMIVVKDAKEILLEVKEQLLPSYLEYFKEFKKIYKDNYKNLSNAEIHKLAKEKMINDYDENLKVFDYECKNFLIKSIFNAKYSVDAEKFFDKKEDDIDNFIDNLKEYITFSAISLSNAHKKSALKKEFFVKSIKRVSKNHRFEIETMVLKSYSTNILMYEHFLRDLKERNV